MHFLSFSIQLLTTCSGDRDKCFICIFYVAILASLEVVSQIPWLSSPYTANCIHSNIKHNRHRTNIQFTELTRPRHTLPSVYSCLRTTLHHWACGGIDWANKQLAVYLQLSILNEDRWVNLHTSKGCHCAMLTLISHLDSYHAHEGMSKQDATAGGMEGWGTCLQSTSQSESVKSKC